MNPRTAPLLRWRGRQALIRIFEARTMNRALLLSLLVLSASAFAQGGPAPSAVRVSRAELRAIAPSVTVTGVVQSRAAADLAAPVAGRLLWVAEPGTEVKAGDVVARFDIEELQLQRAEQQARVTRGEVAVKAAEREAERLRAAGTAISRVQLNQAEDVRDLAKGDLEIARVSLRQTQERLSRAVLRAPVAGVVSERIKRAGEEAARGELIARFADTGNLELRLFLPLRHVRAIHNGTEVRVLSASGIASAGKVRAVVPVGDARSQSFEALVDVASLKPQPPVGETLRVELPLEAARNALVVPRDAVVIRAEGNAVFRLRDGPQQSRVAERIPVRLGVADGAYVAVEGALAPDDEVVIRGAETLADGAPVKVVDLSSAVARQTGAAGGRG
ncbi:efflux RND transporter periplasmic adaptor subunit [Stagnimonas aquatica]|uniref:Efflux RND transporter periplasmic adaptor subunit n=2 Tax=Stagnimonas aquatica TaxID=2689987 RepID=A0A3N0VM88_9GAMM|nr:efflux RND transporter periplasmic adaptor subunit [Stagnimonas aquatica]